MLRRLSRAGTGTRAEPAYCRAAGKTGTAQKSLNAGGYAEGRYVVSFAGLVPWDRPELCIIVILDEPAGGASGGSAAAPVFSAVANRVLPYYGTGAALVTAGDPFAGKGCVGVAF